MSVNRNRAIWYFFTTLLTIFNICTIRIFDRGWPLYVVTANAIVSLCGLVYHMHVDKIAAKRPFMRFVRAMLFLNSISVAVMLLLSLFILNSQYHNRLTADGKVNSEEEVKEFVEGTDKDVVILETENLYIFCPKYESISFVSGERPKKSDKSIALCVAAAFQAKYNYRFTEDEIVGWHASDGRLERGKPEKNLGALTYVDGVPRIWDVNEAEEAVKKAAEEGGTGYQQFVVLYEGKRGTHDSDEFRCFRVLALLNDRLCIIDSAKQMHYSEYIDALEKLGVRNALYCDMGSGWNYSWYRNEEETAVDIIGSPWPFSHNWLVFRGRFPD